MRTTTHFLLALTSLLVAAPACDVEEDLDFIDEDESIGFRCGVPCLSGGNSPYLGVWDITNLSTRAGTLSESPDGTLSMSWTGTQNGLTIGSILLSPQGEARVSLTGSPSAPLIDAFFNLTITEGNTTHNGKIRFKHATSVQGDEDPNFLVSRYDIRTNVYPGPDHVSFGEYEGYQWWSVCPTSQDSTNTAVLLKQTHADQLGESGSVREASLDFVIACDGHAMSKGVTQLNIIPYGGTARSYGYDHYSSLIQGWQALFQGDSWTYLGAKVGVIDTLHSPPLFDTRDPITLPPPMLGNYQWILESVYKDTGTNNRGAQCKFTGHVMRPGGDHRNSLYDAPVTKIPGWSNLPECSGALNQYGDVAFYSVSFVAYGPL